MAELPRIGKYENRRVLGQGAMATVYEAWDPDIERAVAIKTIRTDLVEPAIAQQFLARFRNEAKAAGRLLHPNIVGVYEFGEQGALAYIVMEYVEGTDLREHLSRKGAFDFSVLVALFSQLLDALSLAHSRGIVHRDIKPANLIVTGEGVLKVADFGVARIDRSNLTSTGVYIGTPAYMSPEQCMGLEVDARSDLFSTGVVLYELIAARKPFAGSIESIAYKICHEEPAPPSASASGPLPGALDRLVATALAKKPEARFQTAQAFKAALQEVARMPAGASDRDGTTLAGDIGTLLLQVSRAQWDDATLGTAERELARIVGPVARILVKRAAAQTRDRVELCSLLADSIDDPVTRERFRRTLTEATITASHHTGATAAPGSLGAKASATQPSHAGVAGTSATSASSPVDAAFVDRMAVRLAAHLGPIARVLAKQAAARSFSREDFVRLCSDALDGDARAQFMRAALDDERGPSKSQG